MSWTERLAQLTFALVLLAVAGAALVVGRGFVTGVWPFAGAVDRQTGTAAIRVETDAGTGCQYVLTPLGGIVPRTGADGRQVCAAARR